ncbi:hypothetical protein KR026_006452, partial [Drosophila bipectinata]
IYFQEYAKHNNKNGALSSDTDRPTYSHISCGTNFSRENFKDLWEYKERDEKCEINRSLNSVPIIDNHSYSYNYLDCYKGEDPHGVTVDDWDGVESWDSTTVVAVEYSFEYSNPRCTSSKLLPMLPVKQNISRTPQLSSEMDLKIQGMCIKREKRNGVCMAKTNQAVNLHSSKCNENQDFEYSSNFLKNRGVAAPSRALQQKCVYSHQGLFGFTTDPEDTRNLLKSNRSTDQLGGVSVGSGTCAWRQTMRPYTSMLPLDYNDYQACSYNADSLSTYSDTSSTNHDQLKLQQQRKISLMMAMTTASVIASGETRIPVQSKHTKKPTHNHTDFLLDNSNFSQKGISERLLEPDIYSRGSHPQSDVEAVEYTITVADSTNPKTRKLPKLLPAPQYKSPIHTPVSTVKKMDALNSTLYSSCPITENIHRAKQLPKLPISINQTISHSISLTSPINSVKVAGTETEPLLVSLKNCSIENNHLICHDSKESKNMVNLQWINEERIPSPLTLELSQSVESLFKIKNPSSPTCNSLKGEAKNVVIDLDLKETYLRSQSILEPKKTPNTEPEEVFDNITEYLKPYNLDTSFSLEQQFHDDTITSNIEYNYPKGRNNSVEGILRNSEEATAYVNYDFPESFPENIVSTSTSLCLTQNEPVHQLMVCTSIDGVSSDSNKAQINPIVMQFPIRSPHDISVSTVCNSNQNAFTNNASAMAEVASRDVSPSPSTLTLTSPSSVAPILSYSEYMKQFELPDLPQPIIPLSSPVSVDKSDSGPTSSVGTSTKVYSMPDCNLSELPTTPCKENVSTNHIKDFRTPSQEPQVNNYKEDPPNSVSLIPNTTIECSVEPKTSTIPMTDRDVILSQTLSFDDSFYDSFNVDLKKLTASIADTNIENGLFKNTHLTQDCTIDFYSREPNEFSIEPRDLNQNLQTRFHEDIPPQSNISTFSNDPIQQANIAVTSTAQNVLGEFSKGFKGGSDGVLNSDALTVDVSAQVNSKKVFGFNLSSKLIPTVNELLYNSNPSENKQSASVPKFTETEIILNPTSNFMDSNVSPISYDHKEHNFYLTEVPNFPVENKFYNNETMSTNSTVEKQKDSIDESCNAMILSRKAIQQNQQKLVYRTDEKQNEIVTDYDISYIENDNEYDLIQPKATNSHIKHQITKKNNTTGSMFGSIFGKAAAAVQTATQVVNQSASSVASAMTQKQSLNTLSVIESPNVVEPSNLTSSNKLNEMNLEYNEYSMSNDVAIVTDFTNNGNNYENINVQYASDLDKKSLSYLGTNGNQTQLGSAISGKLNEIGNASKLLPKVPLPSISKKLPIINGKLGLLTKQLPTEIYEDELDIDEIELNTIGKDTRFCMESEHDNYSMKLRQTPSHQSNSYYEPNNSSYDYREDYFNEEDENKYLEQQDQKKKEPFHVQQMDQSESVFLSEQPSSASEFITEERDTELIYENYQSEEESLTYLDESSSGSVEPIESKKMLKRTLGDQKDSNGETSTINRNISLQILPSFQQVQDNEIIFDDSKLNRSQEQICMDSFEKFEELNDQLSDLSDLRKITSTRKKPLIRGETEEVVGGHMQIIRHSEVTAKQRWHWALNKVILQLNVSK